MIDPIERARRYLAKLPPAIAGSGGHFTTFNAAVAMIRGFSLSPEKALGLMMEWNERCLPPWSEADIRHKLTDATKSTRCDGYLLGTEAPVDDAGAKAAKRRQWPLFRGLTTDDIHVIATLRGVSPDAAYLIASHGHLWRCRDHHSHECFVIRSGTFAQKRRMDGQPFTRGDGGKIKALNLPGSEGSFLSPGGIGRPDTPVIVTEGAVSLLEAAEAVLRADHNAGRLHSVAILAAVSAGSRFTPGNLEMLTGRRVRIIPDTDHAGREAAAIWTATLRSVGCVVDCISLPPACKDLGDALRAITASDAFWHQLLTF